MLARSRRFTTTIPVPKRVHRINETLEAKKSRLLYQSRKRGILEMDLLCSLYAKKYLPVLNSHTELDNYDKLLDEMDCKF